MAGTTTRTREARKEAAARAVAPAASADPPSREGRECRDGDSTVQSLARALQLIELLSDDDEGYRLVDLAARSGLSTSTVHRLLTTLEQRQFVQFDRERSLWYVGVRCFSVGAAFARRRRISELALPVMHRLSALSGETVNLGVASDGQIVFACQAEGPHGSRALARPGQRAPLHGTAMGQAVLAAKSEPDVLQYLRTFGLPRLTNNTIARPSRCMRRWPKCAGAAMRWTTSRMRSACAALLLPFVTSTAGPSRRCRWPVPASASCVHASMSLAPGCVGLPQRSALPTAGAAPGCPARCQCPQRLCLSTRVRRKVIDS